MNFEVIHRRRTDVDLKLTPRQWDVFESLHWWGPNWVRPMDIGGRNASHHSKTLAQLVRRGLVDVQQRSTGRRGSKVYRLSNEGMMAYDSLWEEL